MKLKEMIESFKDVNEEMVKTAIELAKECNNHEATLYLIKKLSKK